MKKLSDLQAAVLNENERYKADIKNMRTLLVSMADEAAESGLNTTVSLSAGGVNGLDKMLVEIPFNAETFELLIDVLDELAESATPVGVGTLHNDLGSFMKAANAKK
jgi:hypothetical protein